MKDNKKGFTLIELLAVIAILAILMLLVTPRIVKSIKSSKKDTFYDNVTLIYNTAILEYVDDNAKNNEYCDTCSNNLGNKIPNKFEYDVKFEDDKLIYIKITDKEYIYVKSDKNGINKKDLSKDDVKEYDPNTPSEDENPQSETLIEKLLNDNPTISTRTDFSTVFTTTNTETLYKATESIAGSTAKDVYYFAGDAKNNWVKFGKHKSSNVKYRGYYSATTTNHKDYSTMEECTSATSYNTNCTEIKYYSAGDDIYWRIIRTNADGSIRLLYSGTSPDTTTGYIGESEFNENYKSPKYVGYMYGDSDTTLEEARTNINDSTIKTVVDNWYENNLVTYTNYLSNDAVYCNDRELRSGSTYSTGTAYEDGFNFKPYERLIKNKTPTYDCANNKDAFSVNNTEAKLKYPIGLMTADEIAYAGGVYFTALTSPYAWYYLNSTGGSITGVSYWQSLSPVRWSDGRARSWVVFVSGLPGGLDISVVVNSHAVRPVTSLKSCVQWKSGNGSASNPYEIQMNGGC